MRIGWSQGHDEQLPRERCTGLTAALARRGLEVVPVTEPTESVEAVVLAAPAGRLGPDRVHDWRRWASSGRHLLVLGAVSDEAPAPDCGWILPGLEITAAPRERVVLDLPDRPWSSSRPLALQAFGGRIVGRGPARLEPPTPSRAGALRPKGRSWFRVSRTWDVHEAWAHPSTGWALVQLGAGEGSLTLLADGQALADDALADVDHRRLLARVLHAWLPDLHAHVLRRALDGVPLELPPVEADPERAARLAEGVPVDAVLVPGGPVAAVRALAEQSLVAHEGGLLRLTERGRAEQDLVASVLALESAFARDDRRWLPG